MKGLVIEGPQKVTLKEVPTPKPGSGEVMVRVRAAGVCGTDVHIYHGEFIASYPLIPGHEFAGEVAEVGPGVRDWKPGDRVTVDPSIFCGDCYFCKSNRGNHCLNWNGIGATRNGGFAEYALVPVANLYKIKDSLSFQEGAFIEPISCVVYGLKRVNVQIGDSVLIFGSGPIGLLLLQLTKHGGASSVTVVDVQEKRLTLARQLGASHTILADGSEAEELTAISPLGFDVVIDATGVPAVVERVFAYIKSGGKLLVFGVCPSDSKIQVSPFDIYRHDWKIYGSFALCYTFYPARDLLENGVVSVKPLISLTIPLEEAVEIFRSPEKFEDSLKIVVTP
ncbi:threonine 3-dehydrogenase [Candidatus Hakubella thermalkaliphila]|nr:threonine 3-dehydrogenase [Candidatus Hakubella thermalkaliphila]